MYICRQAVCLDGDAHIYSSASESGYEPIDPNESQTSDELPRCLEHGGRAEREGLEPIPEAVEGNETMVVNSNHEPMELKKPSVLKAVQLEDTAPRDSMIDNTAYSMVSHGTGVSEGDSSEEQGQYEAVVMLQNNSCYDCVTPGRGEYSYATMPPTDTCS